MEKNKKVIDFDDGMNFVLEEHSLYAKDPISDFFETADVKKMVNNLIAQRRWFFGL